MINCKQAKEHPEYKKALKIARKGGFVRQLRTFQDVNAVLDGCYFDKSAADYVVDFFLLLHHTKGRSAGERFELFAWEKNDIVYPLFGWKRPDGTRRFRRVYVEIPRKGGKTTFCAGLAAYFLIADNEPGAEVYSAAKEREQASRIYNEVVGMTDGSSLRKRITPTPSGKSIKCGDSIFRALCSDAGSAHGLNIHACIFDELHVQTKRDLWEALITGQGGRDNPVFISITTAGYDRSTICWEEHELARQVIEGAVDKTDFLGVIYAADENDDPFSEATWRKANPSYDFMPSIRRQLKAEFDDARASPAKLDSCLRLYLNIWTQSQSRWIEREQWDACGGAIDREALRGRLCYGGLDLSTTKDITAFVLVFPPEDDGDKFIVLPEFWVPAECIDTRAVKDGIPYNTWARQGLIHTTDGAAVDYAFIMKRIDELSSEFDIAEVAYDRWGASAISTELDNRGHTLVKFGQGFGSMAAPCKELIHMVTTKNINHGNNPVLNWMSDNMVFRTDPAGNLKPDKEKSNEKIDGMVAMLMALDRACVHENSAKPGIVVY